MNKSKKPLRPTTDSTYNVDNQYSNNINNTNNNTDNTNESTSNNINNTNTINNNKTNTSKTPFSNPNTGKQDPFNNAYSNPNYNTNKITNMSSKTVENNVNSSDLNNRTNNTSYEENTNTNYNNSNSTNKNNNYNNNYNNNNSDNNITKNQFSNNNNNNYQNNNLNKNTEQYGTSTPQQFKKSSIQTVSTPKSSGSNAKFNPYTNSGTSQSHKRTDKDYKINPKVIPRPNHFDEVHKNKDKEPIFFTNEDSLPPHSNTYFVTSETDNSNPRLIRSTMTKIPQDPSIMASSNLNFGLIVSPFSELLVNNNSKDNENIENNNDYNLLSEEEIPKVEAEEGIFRCKRCDGYINNKFKIDFSNNYNKVAVCNLCGMSNELNPNNPTVKSSYSSSIGGAEELVKPSVDFHAPKSFRIGSPFEPHYLFMIDTSNVALEYGVPSYVS